MEGIARSAGFFVDETKVSATLIDATLRWLIAVSYTHLICGNQRAASCSVMPAARRNWLMSMLGPRYLENLNHVPFCLDERSQEHGFDDDF